MLLGFNTSAFYKFMQPASLEAVVLCREIGCKIIELGCGRPERLFKLGEINKDDLLGFDIITLHAPALNKYFNNEKTHKYLNKIKEYNNKYNFKHAVIHPDLVEDWSIFSSYNFKIVIENMDQNKSFGKRINDLEEIFNNYNYEIVLDLSHCFTNDKTMKLVNEFYSKFKERIVEIHISGHIKSHEPLFITKQKEILKAIPDKDLPIIIESACKNEKEAKQEFKYIKSYLENN